MCVCRGCFLQDGIIKVYAEIRPDMRSAPIQEEQKLFLCQGLLNRGCIPSLLDGVSSIDRYVALMAKQIIEESEVFSPHEQQWTQILLRLSRVVADNLTEDSEEGFKLLSPSLLPSMQTDSPVSGSKLELLHMDSNAFRTDRDVSPPPNADLWLSPSSELGLERWGGSISSLKEVMNVVCIEGGTPEQSMFVDGYLMKKNLAHKKMKRRIVAPRILLIACPIEYYKSKNQYASLETLLTQEQE